MGLLGSIYLRGSCGGTGLSSWGCVALNIDRRVQASNQSLQRLPWRKTAEERRTRRLSSFELNELSSLMHVLRRSWICYFSFFDGSVATIARSYVCMYRAPPVLCHMRVPVCARAVVRAPGRRHNVPHCVCGTVWTVVYEVVRVCSASGVSARVRARACCMLLWRTDMLLLLRLHPCILHFIA